MTKDRNNGLVRKRLRVWSPGARSHGVRAPGVGASGGRALAGCVLTAWLLTLSVLTAVPVFGCGTFRSGSSLPADSMIIRIDGNDEGRVFEGVGAVSAGGSSRLLIDYPEPYRSDILDYLFKPKFGASLQHLKVEIGGDVNSTAGTEPSHARTRTEMEYPRREYYQRGYEYWLMSQASERNPEIIFDCLQWGAPGWFRGGFYSQDNANYIVAFIKGAKKYHQVDVRFAGTWNEKRSEHTRDWIVNTLRPALDRNGLAHVGIVADDWHTPQWQFAAEVLGDTALSAAVHALGYHYVEGSSTDTARLTGLPLWESEAWSKSGEWLYALQLARQINLNYIRGRITKTEIWNPVDAYYENLAWSGMGAMTASMPWSGHYQVEPAIWALAHTTQFAQPGWTYLDSGCDTTAAGTYFVTLKSPGAVRNNGAALHKAGSSQGKDYSIIITGGEQAETLHFILSNLSGQPLQVWRSDSTRQFQQLETIHPRGGGFSLRIDPGAIYSLSTTSGQQKGQPSRPVPPQRGFPRNYTENLESYDGGQTPAYIADQGGAFEVYMSPDGNHSLRQVITGKLIPWDAWGPNNPEPFTEFGEFFSNYQVSARVLIEDSGSVKLFGRVKYFESNKSAHGYGLTVDHRGNWELLRFQTVLDSGRVKFSANNWHQLRLEFQGDRIRAFIDRRRVSELIDTTYAKGYAGLGTGWNHARFDDIRLTAK